MISRHVTVYFVVSGRLTIAQDNAFMSDDYQEDNNQSTM
jgi:hypothetical protein